ncbi:MAG: hypothetical protein E7016_05290 [Alphaproteobacteria bacterium]|nr:hypothetical protein [Alphaproteobacteria bacterium]
MRKYFLTTAVALLATSTANAEALNSTVQVNAKVEYVTDMTCTPLNFGTIYLKSGNSKSTLDLEFMGTTGNIVEVTGASVGKCNFNPVYDDDGVYVNPNYIISGLMEELDRLSLYDNGEDIVAYVDNIRVHGDGNIYAQLTIEGDVPAQSYSGSFSITVLQ